MWLHFLYKWTLDAFYVNMCDDENNSKVMATHDDSAN
jgi:hypothetical protein